MGPIPVGTSVCVVEHLRPSVSCVCVWGGGCVTYVCVCVLVSVGACIEYIYYARLGQTTTEEQLA